MKDVNAKEMIDNDNNERINNNDNKDNQQNNPKNDKNNNDNGNDKKITIIVKIIRMAMIKKREIMARQ